MRFFFPAVLLAALQFYAGSVAAAVTVIGSNFAHDCYIAARDNSANTEPCDKALEIEPLVGRDRAATYVNRAIVLTNGRHLSAALADLERAEAVKPDLGEIYASRGNVYYFRHRYEDALKEYDLGLAKGITEVFAVQYNRGLALERLGRIEEAKEAFHQALALAPGFDLAKERLAQYESDAVTQ